MTTKAKSTRKTAQLLERLSQLTRGQVIRLLGRHGEQLLQQGASFDSFDFDRDIYVRTNLFRLRIAGAGDYGQDVTVDLRLDKPQGRLRWDCDCCHETCQHVGAAFSLILEDKYLLGIEGMPDTRIPWEHLSDDDLLKRALAERKQRAREERFRLRTADAL